MKKEEEKHVNEEEFSEEEFQQLENSMIYHSVINTLDNSTAQEITDAILLLSESYHTDWDAQVDFTRSVAWNVESLRLDKKNKKENHQ